MARSHVMVRQIRQDEFGEVAPLLDASGKFWPNKVFSLPLTRLMVAEKWEDKGPRPILYQPLYPSLFLGSFVKAEKATDAEIAESLLSITREGYSRANEWGMAELMLSTATPETSGFAERHGWSYAHPTYRMEVRK